jgi:pimeloyl-ACP methyl ester carboxylesterase
MSTFVLVHGAWHSGSAWTDVIQRLRRHGHAAFAPTMAGSGKGVSKQVSHAEQTQSIVDFIKDRDLTDIVLVGHSYGGTIISKVVEVVSDRVRRLVYWNGYVLLDGESVADASPPNFRQLVEELAVASPDNSVMLPFDIWRETFINDGDLDLALSTYAQLSPEPVQPSLEPLDLKKFYSLTTPRSYINGTEDVVMPPGEWGWHPRMSSRLGLHRFLQIPGGHELLFTNPNGLADKIIEAGRD